MKKKIQNQLTTPRAGRTFNLSGKETANAMHAKRAIHVNRTPNVNPNARVAFIAA